MSQPELAATTHDATGPKLVYLAVVLRHLRLLTLVLVVSSVTALALAFLLPVRYASVASFLPETKSTTTLPSSVAGLASQLGLSVGTDAGQSPNFYASLLMSQTLLERILQQRFPQHGLQMNERPDSAALLDIWKTGGTTDRERLDRGLRRLRNALGVTTDARTNIVRLEVQADDPALAANIANEFVRDVNDFNGNQRRSQAHERRRFVEEQATEAQGQLADAEGTLRNFYSANRQFRESPELTYREAQLRRQVDIAQELYLNLRRELEAARIQEVNDTPVLTVIDSAVPSSKRSFPNRRLFVAVGLCLGIVFGVLACLAVEYYQDLMRMQNPAVVQLRDRLARIRIRATRRA